MEPQSVCASTNKVIGDDPTVAGDTRNCTAVYDFQVAIAAVLGFATGEAPNRIDSLAVDATMCPIEPQKASRTPHLFATVNRDRVVHGGSGQSVGPRRLAVIQIGAGIAGNVDATKPEVHV